MAGWWFLCFAVAGALLVLNAAKPRRGPIMLVPSWILAFITTDLAFLHLVLQLIVAVGCVWAGALETLQGKLALAIMVLSDVGLVALWLPNLRAPQVASEVAASLHLDEVAPIPRAMLLTPFRRGRSGVSAERDLEFFQAGGHTLELDVYQPEQTTGRRPGLVYLHGGAWMFGDKVSQGLPLCNHLASLGWVCVNANYRLSPGATYPEHVVDAKAAVAWLRRHADDYNVNPAFIAIAGGSSGAHIASTLALTPDDRSLQPGFEAEDARVQAVVTYYGIYDLTNRHGAHNDEFFTKLVGPHVLKACPVTDPERFRAASPREIVSEAAPPWLVVHGGGDTLVPVIEARDFAAALGSASRHTAGYAEFPGAVHGFDIYYSPRAIAAVELSARFLVTAHRQAMGHS
ncbi:MAG: alpha/beta hydrolase [Woeseiaceae bacterium]|nr:alpha/beta hydrolase [Woeseiaceae bacterium]